jgi:hypothetical protein
LSRAGLPVSASQLTEVIQHEIDGAITELAPRERGFFLPFDAFTIKQGGLRLEAAPGLFGCSNQTSMIAMILWLRSTMMI